MAHPVKCKYCGQTFDRDKVEHVQVSKARYAHIECYKEQQLSISQEEKDYIHKEWCNTFQEDM